MFLIHKPVFSLVNTQIIDECDDDPSGSTSDEFSGSRIDSLGSSAVSPSQSVGHQ